MITSTQTNIALQIVDTLSMEELAVFAKEFEKKYKKNTVTRNKDKKIKPKSIMPSHEQCIKQIKAMYNIQAQDKLA